MRNKEYQGWEEGWAVVEVGSDVIAGWVSYDGGLFSQVDVPAVEEGQPAFTRFVAIHAVRTVTPCSEWGIYQILEEKYDDTLCDAFHFNAYTQHASEPDGTIPEPIDPDKIPF